MIAKLQQYKELLPIGALLMYALGGVYYIFYYEAFGVNIIPYLSLFEVLIQSLIFIPILIFCTIIIELSLVLLISLITQLSKKAEKYIKGGSVYISISFAIQFVLLFTVILWSGLTPVWLASYLLLMILKIWVMISAEFRKAENKRGIMAFYSGLFVFMLSTLLYAYSEKANNDAENVLTGEDNYRIEIALEDKEYSTITNNNLFFIGETNSYYFLYEKSVNNTIIIDKDNVKEAILHNEALGAGIIKRWLKRNNYYPPDKE